jgi:hypothetical protein
MHYVPKVTLIIVEWKQRKQNNFESTVGLTSETECQIKIIKTVAIGVLESNWEKNAQRVPKTTRENNNCSRQLFRQVCT